jgi:hypothetical protein
MFTGQSIVLSGDEKVSLDVGPYGTRVVIRDGSASFTFDLRDRGIAHLLATTFETAQESMAGEKAARLAMLEQALRAAA